MKELIEELHLYCDASVGSQRKLYRGQTTLATSTFYWVWPDGDYLGGTSSLQVPHGRSDVAELEGLRRACHALSETLREIWKGTRRSAHGIIHCDNRIACETMRSEFQPSCYPRIADVKCTQTSRTHPMIQLCHDECGEMRRTMERMLLGKPPRKI